MGELLTGWLKFIHRNKLFINMLELFEYSFFQNALVSTILISICCGLVGTYIVAKRMVFISGGITHASFGGLGLAYYLGVSPMLGAGFFAVASSLSILYLGDSKKFREDSLIGMFWSAGMAIGIIFIYMTPGYAPNLMTYLFGNILTVVNEHIVMLSIFTVIISIFFAIFYRPLFFIAFDKSYSKTHRINVNIVDAAMSIIIALCIVICLKLAGLILVISYLTLPQAIANLYYINFKQQLVTATIISIVGSVGGLFMAALLDIPSGACIVLCFIVLFAILFGVRWITTKLNHETL